MSKFFKGAVSSSDSSDSDDSVDVLQKVVAPQRNLVRDFAYPSDSDDDRPKRVVRASKDKIYDELKEQIRLAHNARKIKDVTSLQSAFETLCRLYDKVKPIIAREGLTIPRFYIRYLSEVQDFVNDLWEDKEARKSMAKANSKNLTSLRQKVRKYAKDFETEVNTYKEGPDPVGYSSGAAEDDDDEDAESTEKPQELSALVYTATAKKKREKALDSDSDWSSNSTDSSSESDIDLEGKQMEDLRKFFLKKEKTDKSKTKEKEGRRNREAKQKVESEDENEEEWKKITHKDDAQKPLFHSKAEINIETVIKRLAEINSNRGRKATNRKIYVRNLQELYKIADEHEMGVGVLAKILASIISALFELNTRVIEAMDFHAWMKTLEAVDGFLNLLVENPKVSVSILVNEDEENLTNLEEPLTVNGSTILMVKHLADELTKIYQHTDCHSTDYIEKLKGEKELYSLIVKAQNYVDSRKDSPLLDKNEVVIIYMLHIEHLYYKYSPNEADTRQLMDRMCKMIYAMGSTAAQQRQRAMLCQIYHYAIHDRWQEAKNLMLMSHLQAIVDHSDANTQVLYNRTICQLGLCAFRHGFIREAHQGLSEIQNTQRAKDLLAQGVPYRQVDKTPEQELKERALQVPYHMHINLELMECVYLICSMLLEIPNIACHEYDLRRRLLSRSFHYQLKFSEKSALIGPPENTREHVVAASRAMLKGDWVRCRDFVINEKMNGKVWNLFRNSEAVKQMVITRIQEETLRTYLLMYSTVYKTVSVATLCELFELQKSRVYAIISKMIIQEELSATLDEPTDCLIMHRVEPSRLQLLALNLADKLSQLIDNNEQAVEPRSGRTGYSGPGNWYSQRGAAGAIGQDRQGDEKNRRSNYQQGGRNDRFNQDGKRGAWGSNAGGSGAMGRGIRLPRNRAY